MHSTPINTGTTAIDDNQHGNSTSNNLLEIKASAEDEPKGMVFEDQASGRRLSDGIRKLVQQLAAPGEITESERRRRRATNKRSRVSRKRNQKLARLKKGKKR